MKTKKYTHFSNNKTIKNKVGSLRPPKVVDSQRAKLALSKTCPLKKGGWIILTIRGNPYQRGFVHGFSLHLELKKVLKSFPIMIERSNHQSLNSYLEQTTRIILPIVRQYFPEIYEEIVGIRDGSISAGTPISLEFLIGWNVFCSFDGIQMSKCSAFISTNGEKNIVMAHNTHSDLIIGRLSYVILYIVPEQGFPFVMQTSPGLVWSSMDWWISQSGIIGCETALAGINYKPHFGFPIFCRIRQAMQYGKTLDDYLTILSNQNAGDYACSWLLGDIHTCEIMRFEMGLYIYSIERTFDGVFYGMNGPFNAELRENETNNRDFYDIRTSIGHRNKRFGELLGDGGKITIENVKKIITDDYDLYLGKTGMNDRTIFRKTTINGRFYGSIDAKVVDSEMARNLEFLAKSRGPWTQIMPSI